MSLLEPICELHVSGVEVARTLVSSQVVLGYFDVVVELAHLLSRANEKMRRALLSRLIILANSRKLIVLDHVFVQSGFILSDN